MTDQQDPDRRIENEETVTLSWIAGATLVVVSIIALAYSYNHRVTSEAAINPAATTSPSMTGSGIPGILPAPARPGNYQANR
jgi:hypothetical protein